MKTATKYDLACDLRLHCCVPLSVSDYQRVIDMFIYCITERLKAGDRIEFRGFGIIRAYNTKGRKTMKIKFSKKRGL